MTGTDQGVLVTSGPDVTDLETNRSVWYLGWLLTFLATGEDTGGQFALIEEWGRKGQSAEPPLHTHDREEECFYVIDGAIDCFVGDRQFHVPAGGLIVLPRGVPHRYELATEGVRLLNLCFPAGFENYFRELSEPAQAATLPPPPSGAPDIARIVAVAREHGVEIHPPRTPDEQ